MAMTRKSSARSAEQIKGRIRDALAEASIAEQVNNRVGNLTENAKIVLQRRYLSKDREGNVLEDPEGMFRRVAHNLSQADLNYATSQAERQATDRKSVV